MLLVFLFQDYFFNKLNPPECFELDAHCDVMGYADFGDFMLLIICWMVDIVMWSFTIYCLARLSYIWCKERYIFRQQERELAKNRKRE